ncbi:hypothetical protein MTO96_026651 [Rhipicephalus appendiculatus]
MQRFKLDVGSESPQRGRCGSPGKLTRRSLLLDRLVRCEKQHWHSVRACRSTLEPGVERRKSAAGQRTRTEPKDFVERLTRRKSGEADKTLAAFGTCCCAARSDIGILYEPADQLWSEELSGVRALRVSERGQSRRTAEGSTDEAQRGAASGAEQQGKST